MSKVLVLVLVCQSIAKNLSVKDFNTQIYGANKNLADDPVTPCKNNYDCQPTLCCSTEKCVQPSMCLEGKKLYQDYCDFNFECMTSCCNSNKCSPFVQCYEKCMRNTDCKNTTGCCSQGYCTDKKICLNGGKIKGEYCDLNSECKAKMSCLNNQCVDGLFAYLPGDVIVLVIAIGVSIIVLAIVIYCCFKICSSNKTGEKDGYARSNSNQGQGTPSISS
jgi:hypothetical protein